MGTSISQIIQVTTPPLGVAPGPPTALAVSSITSTSLTLSWTGSSTGSQPITYQAQIKGPGASTFTNYGTASQAVSVAVTGLTPNSAYTFQVLATNSTASTPSSSTVTVTTLGVTPSAPTGLSLSAAAGQTDIPLSWTASATGSLPITYQVLQRTPSGSGTFTAVMPTTTATSQDITGLSPATTYDFEITASNAAGTSAPSAALTGVATANPANILPSAPTNLAGTPASTSIVATWTAPAQGTTPLNYTLQWRPH